MENRDRITITVKGRGGHGSRPDQCVNPIIVASNIILAITAIPVNRYSPLDPLLLFL